MGESLYILDSTSKHLDCVKPVSFCDIGIRERQDLEQWVIAHPEVLGERLLVITSEFDRFDKCSRRLDVLALDENAVLVVVELKLDIEGSLADQQAIRYAAFCHNMTMQDVVSEYARHSAQSEEEATNRICDFLDEEELPELVGQPRIILAAGAVEDQELTSCVLWLRQFGLDITCVELTPYRFPGNGTVVLAPRVIIPLPETRDYQIRLEQKESARMRDARVRILTPGLWKAIGQEFNKLNTGFKAGEGKEKGMYMPLSIGMSEIHYEWIVRKSKHRLDVALHFESSDSAENARM
jgi:hypothetical protein